MNVLQDPELGTILLHRNPRAVRFTFRVREGHLVATVPGLATRGELLKAIEELRPRLRHLLARQQDKHGASRITPDFRIDVEGFSFRTEESSEVQVFTLSWQEGLLVLKYPPGADFGDEDAQQWIVHHIEERLREQAYRNFLPRLERMAQHRGLRFRQLSIHKSRGRWGSCNTRGNIALSLYVLLLPPHLQNYIMQHELTHLLHMDHSERFWAELDRAVGTDSRALRKELKKFDTSIFQRA